MTRVSIIVVGSAFLAAALAATGQEKPALNNAAKKGPTEPYEGFRADQALIRKHLILKVSDGAKNMTTSSGEAIAAAQRIFSRVSFLFRSREEVLDLLGDPATISDYGRPAGKDPSSPLVYIFDTGLGGMMFTISFGRPPKVNQVRVDYLN